MKAQPMAFLPKVLQYEVSVAERYCRFVSLVMIASSDDMRRVQEMLQSTLRSSDVLGEHEGAAMVLMSETDGKGALTAIERYKERGRDMVSDLRFSVATFPQDDGGAPGLIKAAKRRLQEAPAGEFGAVVVAG